MTDIRAACTSLKDAYPALCRHGLAPMRPGDLPDGLECIVEEARRFPDQIEECRMWLRGCNVTQAVRTTHDTYAYKHEVEAGVGHWVSHLSLLVADQHEGVPMEQSTDRPYAALLPLGAKRP